MLAGRRYCDFPVAGTSHHQAQLAAVDQELDHDLKGRLPVILRPQPHNPHDPRAVAVMVGDMVIGHLPADACEDFHAQLAALNPAGRDAACMAYIGHAPEAGYYARLGLSWPLAEADRSDD